MNTRFSRLCYRPRDLQLADSCPCCLGLCMLVGSVGVCFAVDLTAPFALWTAKTRATLRRLFTTNAAVSKSGLVADIVWGLWWVDNDSPLSPCAGYHCPCPNKVLLALGSPRHLAPCATHEKFMHSDFASSISARKRKPQTRNKIYTFVANILSDNPIDFISGQLSAFAR